MTDSRRAVFRATLMLTLAALLTEISVHAQVSIERTDGEIVVRNAGFKEQRATKTAGEDGRGSSWQVSDGMGNSYDACASTCTQSNDGTWTCSSWDSHDAVDKSLIEGYRDALQYLVENYGAVVEHDEVMDLDYVSFPDADDPYDLLTTVLLNDYLYGRPLIDYFKNIEMSSVGVTGEKYNAVKPRGRTLEFPNDPFYSGQWNLDASNLNQALWHPFQASLGRPLRIGVIDSGINHDELDHDGLDGVSLVEHRWTAPTTGFAVPHALAVTTLLAAAGNDESGGVGLLATWGQSCDSRSVFDRNPVEIYSYNIGDWGPISYLVARAISAAIDDRVDVINLSFRTAYSPLIEEYVTRAIGHGIIVVAAAGNYHPSRPSKPTGFPANIDGVIAVGSANQGSSLSNFSATTGVDVFAPGEDILVGAVANSWVYGSGTSFAAPHVVAVAGLLKLAEPDITSEEVAGVLEKTSTKKGSKAGVIDALAALNSLLPQSEQVQQVSIPAACTSGSAAGKSEVVATGESPQTATLLGNYPNPFNPSTVITYSAPSDATVVLSVYDLLGREVDQLSMQAGAGQNQIRFDGSGLASGAYLYRLESESWSLIGRMMLTE